MKEPWHSKSSHIHDLLKTAVKSTVCITDNIHLCKHLFPLLVLVSCSDICTWYGYIILQFPGTGTFCRLKTHQSFRIKVQGQVFYSHVKGKFKKTWVQQNGSALHRFHQSQNPIISTIIPTTPPLLLRNVKNFTSLKHYIIFSTIKGVNVTFLEHTLQLLHISQSTYFQILLTPHATTSNDHFYGYGNSTVFVGC